MEYEVRINSLEMVELYCLQIIMNVLYINLDRRVDRRNTFELECARMGIHAERFPAIEDVYPAIGCVQSHIACLRLARERKYKSVIVFEDDFSFLVSIDTFHRVLNTLPEDYDVVMLDYSIEQREDYNDTFGRILSACTASGYIVHEKMYDCLIDVLQEGLEKFRQQPHAHWLYINDQYWKRVQPISRWYYSLERIGKQAPGFSDLGNKYVEYH